MNKHAVWIVLFASGIVASVMAADSRRVAESVFMAQKGLLGADAGRLQSVDLDRRRVIVNGYEYQAGTDMTAVEVKMLGSSVGALELLAEGMYVHVEYRQLRGKRISIAIRQLEVDRRLDH
jgi:hypothetical protein